MLFDVEVKVSLKDGMLNPEASTITRALGLLGYEVENADTIDIIQFQFQAEDLKSCESQVDDMCQRLLCNPVIHNYEVKIVEI
ncbi:MAG: phosphoribosylformylglycinamidine synthase subunit PurS [Methanobrevibacter sp.]|jgi:phosphoribosylformylglycinamidine synthase|nr:phosphoribosylformylglycinamidine synthase subunit PurS [Candidatus Methanoflexus mossambicus]